MLYRTLGRTGLKVSQLGFGCMRLPMVGEGEKARIDRELSTPMLLRAVELGVTYFDTAIGYCNSDSQRALGEAVKGIREKLVISTKNHYYGESEKEWWTNLENSLERLQTSYIDIYNHHGIGWKSYCDCVEPRLSKWMRKAKDQGLIRHICSSFHDNCEAMIKIVDTGYVDVMTVQYNMLDRGLEAAIAHAHEKGVGVVVMGPVGGGRLGASSEVLASLIPNINHVPELALRFVLANENVSVALSGMSTMQHVEENAKIASDDVALTAEHRKQIEGHLDRLREMAGLYCTGCNYCKPCPNKVDIPGVFTRYNMGRVYGLWEHARQSYAGLMRKNESAEVCVQCGECEPKCPQHIEIRRQLEEAHAALAR